MELSPKFLFCRNLKKISIIQHKNEQKSAWSKERANVTTLLQKISSVETLCGECLDTMMISQHQLRKGKQIYSNVAES